MQLPHEWRYLKCGKDGFISNCTPAVCRLPPTSSLLEDGRWNESRDAQATQLRMQLGALISKDTKSVPLVCYKLSFVSDGIQR